MENNKIERIPIHLKLALTSKEAAEYSNIGINKIDSMLRIPNIRLSCLPHRRSQSSARSLSGASTPSW